MGSGTIRFWLFTFIIIAPAGRILGTDSPKVPTNVAYVSEEDGGISEIDLSTLKGNPSGRTERSLATRTGSYVRRKYVITSNKNTSDGAVFSTRDLSLLRRVHIGQSPEFIKINPAGDQLFATFEPSSEGGHPGAPKAKNDSDDENGPPAQIASFHVGDWVPGPTSTAGQETEGLEFSRDGKLMLVANESQETIGVFDEPPGDICGTSI